MADMPAHIAIDAGGTFTDCVAITANGERRSAKVLSSGILAARILERVDATTFRVHTPWPATRDFARGFRVRPRGEHEGAEAETVARVTRHDPATGLLSLDSDPGPGAVAGARLELTGDENPALLAARLALGIAPTSPLEVAELRYATTAGTNALLERAGAPVALFVTAGFGDLLRIGSQQRPDLFALAVRLRPPITDVVIEVQERLDADGGVITPIDLEALREPALKLRERGIAVAAVALLHAWRQPEHERAVAALLREVGFSYVSVSSEVAPFARLLARAETTVVDAHLQPVLSRRLGQLARQVRAPLHILTSAGGLTPYSGFRAKDSLLSGPAGGLAGAATAARRSGEDSILAFDMGGTSTDVSRFHRDFEYVFEQNVGDARVLAPALAIESIAAGGGSICWFDGHELKVGPASAGAEPGPACFDAGGPLTITDVNLLLGRLDAERFEVHVAREPAERAAEALRAEVERGGHTPTSLHDLLHGLIAIVDEAMAAAIRRVALSRGFEPRSHVLMAFGGAGGQHVAAVARALRVSKAMVPREAAVLSALGVLAARRERFAERQILRPLADVESSLGSWLAELEGEAVRALDDQRRRGDATVRRIATLRYQQQDAALEVDAAGDGADLGDDFRRRYFAIFGYTPEKRPIELVALRVVASLAEAEAGAAPTPSSIPAPPPRRRVRAAVERDFAEVPEFDRDDLAPGMTVPGPALVRDQHSTIVIPGYASARVDGAHALVLTLADAATSAPEPVLEAARRELYQSRFRAIAEEMGARLQRAALSTNIKERLDFSCALLDADAELLVNAPHIPVHLGSLGLCVQRLRESLILGPGDVVATNHPRFGGSHLPDVTLVAPVHAASGRVLGYVAARAHHAEIGGVRPGSMPADATCLAEEGVVLPPTYVRRDRVVSFDGITRRLREAPYPSRAVDENLADLAATLAACMHGAEAFRALADRHGEVELRAVMTSLHEHSEARMRSALSKLPAGTHRAVEILDDGTPLRVSITLQDGHAQVSFAGSAPTHPGNLNATPAIVHSVVLYVLRVLVAEPLPLNGGLLRAVTLDIPRGILNPGFPSDPHRAPAIVGGNVETSQRLVDLLFKALGMAAASQGTMNNLAIGDEGFGYYETIGGGTGAGPGFGGASAVHSHMTNTRATDPEILEARYPLRVWRHAVRTASGGVGHMRGGDGIVRELEFLAPVTVSILSQRRLTAPYGVAGGRDGLPGAQRLVRASGEQVELAPIISVAVEAGDRLLIETPGGGGYGAVATPE